jgi:predicted  nucleic acid-binding Zn-ribbon protein
MTPTAEKTPRRLELPALIQDAMNRLEELEQELQDEIEYIDEEREALQDAGSNTVYCGYGIWVDNLKKDIVELEDAINDMEIELKNLNQPLRAKKCTFILCSLAGRRLPQSKILSVTLKATGEC